MNCTDCATGDVVALGRCGPCYHRQYYRANRSTFARKGQENYRRNREQAKAMQRDYHLRSKYGITTEEYERRLQQQGGGCALCGVPPKRHRLHVDHDKQTGRIRGILCISCNTSLGHLGDTPESLRKVIEYMERES